MQYQWFDSHNNAISCIEKNKILNDNMEEILQTLQDAQEDAILMGVTKESFLYNLHKMLNECYNLKT